MQWDQHLVLRVKVRREGADLQVKLPEVSLVQQVMMGTPTPVEATIADHIGSMNMTVGILAALFASKVVAKVSE